MTRSRGRRGAGAAAAAWAVCAAVLAAAPAARAEMTVEPAPAPIVPVKPVDTGLNTSHKLMFGVRIAGGTGFEYIIRYSGSPPGWCPGDTCTRRSSFFGDVELTFGVSGAIELIAGIRYGFEANSNSEHDILIRPGIIGYLDESSNLKIFLILQGLFEVTGDLNVGAAPGLGVQWDFLPYCGFYLQAQASFMALGVVRFLAEGSFGVQGRIGPSK
jgi:hypothetical protein